MVQKQPSFLSANTLSSSKEFRAKVEERDTSGGEG